jgi:hypothetical protein
VGVFLSLLMTRDRQMHTRSDERMHPPAQAA